MELRKLAACLCPALLTALCWAGPVEDRLRDFERSRSAAEANAFFGQLTSEDFIDGAPLFTKASPRDSMLAQVWYWAGEWFYDIADYERADQYARKALPYFQSGGICDDRSAEADCLSLLSLIHVRTADFEQALSFARACYLLDEESGDPDRISSSLNTMAGICLAAGRPQDGEQYILLGIEAAAKTGNTARQAVLAGMASEIYHALGNEEKALGYITDAYEADMAAGRSERATVRLVQKASILLGMNRSEEAEQILSEAIPALREGQDVHSLALACNKMGRALLDQDRSDEAVPWLSEAAGLFSRMKDGYNEAQSRRALYEALYSSDPAAAKAQFDRFNSLRDSLYSTASAESLARYNAEFGADRLRSQSEADRRAKMLAMLVAALLAIGAGALWLVMRIRHRRQARINEKLSTDIDELRERYRQLNVQYDNAMLTKKDEDEDAALKGPDREFLERVVAVTNDMIDRGSIDAATVASQLGLSLFQLRQRLQVLTGETPQAFIQMLRMRRARHLLDNHPELNVTEIAALCAYSDTPNFTRAFKNAFGLTPTQYIERQKYPTEGEKSAN